MTYSETEYLVSSASTHSLTSNSYAIKCKKILIIGNYVNNAWDENTNKADNKQAKKKNGQDKISLLIREMKIKRRIMLLHSIEGSS